MEFCIDKGGERLASPEIRDSLYPWTDGIMQSITSFKTAKVKVKADAPSIKEKGLKSMVSEPMDEHVSFENFFPQLIAATKEALSKVPSLVCRDDLDLVWFLESANFKRNWSVAGSNPLT